jgi:transcriptional regulator with XRE-family HTH domain
MQGIVPQVIYKLPNEEIEIGKRLRTFREELKIPRTAFALEIGIGGERLASYESGRARLPWTVFESISKKFRLNPFWLLREEGSSVFPVESDYSQYVKDVPAHSAFSHVLRDVIEKNFDSGMYQLQHQISFLHSQVKYMARTLLERRNKAGLAKLMPDMATQKKLAELRRAFPWLIKEVLRDIVAFTDKELEEAGVSLERLDILPMETEETGKKELTWPSEKRKVGSMKSPIQVLLDRVRRGTKAKGQKAALAKFLNVSQSRVSEWLRGKNEPGGEITLRLLEWVTAQEAQQKSPGGVESTARGKTRSLHSNNENKNQSGPGQ